MPYPPSRAIVSLLIAAVVFVTLFNHMSQPNRLRFVPSKYDWSLHPRKNQILVKDMAKPPRGWPAQLPRIQHDFSATDLKKRDIETTAQRRDEIKQAFRKTWAAYEKYAWGRDELLPLSLEGRDNFGGWAATLVDNLDTLWIMDMKTEFYRAADFVVRIDWDSPASDGFNVFETTIRHLGGLLSAYELSGEHFLLAKAIELGDLLYAAFDNPQQMPPHSISFHDLKRSRGHPEPRQSAASLGSMTLEFTRLSQQSGNPKYYDAVDRITRAFERKQNETNLPGLWPIQINALTDFGVSGDTFTLGANGDSLYEYLIKEYLLLQGLEPVYKKMYLDAADTAIKNLVFRPRLPDKDDVLMLGEGNVRPSKKVTLKTHVEHLTCFAGGMFAIGGRALKRDDHVIIGEKLARGCAHAYSAYPSGLMPEIVGLQACPTLEPCEFDENSATSSVAPGFQARDRPYLLRPEAIESIFVLYRVTGNGEFREIAWNMWTSIRAAAETKEAFAAVEDVTSGELRQRDYMESFWLAETLKYFYLIFEDEDVISLDEWVFNTEAHPLRRMAN
ncbi:hypothetical protein ACJZ2D_013872 [Fusarium nematophilum]